MWHEWNMNADDVMITWFAFYVTPDDVMYGMHDACAHQWHMLTENDAKHTFKAPCCCFENAPNTDLLFFRQSM